MAKPNSASPRISAHLDRLLETGVMDVERYLDERDIVAIRNNFSRPDLVLRYVSDQLSLAESRESFLRYSALRQVEALLKKNVDLPGTSHQSRRDAAFEVFAEAERQCELTNERLKLASIQLDSVPPLVRDVLNVARDLLSGVFGDLSEIDFTIVMEGTGFGPGSTFLCKEPDDKHLYFKVSGQHSVTEEALPYAKVMLNRSPHWKQGLIDGGSTFERVRGNRLVTVEKTAMIDRTIAVEPSLNVCLQKGVDQFLSGRLRRFGVSLTNQKRNHGPARLGSMRPLHAGTVDLKSASDTISIELVRLLVPHLWFVFLDDIRSQEYTLDKGTTWHRYAKFSSMGNAFTFPLQSAIFYGLAKACTLLCGGNLRVLRVYGDDIVIDPRAALLLYEVLGFCGFTPNTDKSYLFGNFRETCGKDFLSGVDTRPVYVKKLPTTDQEVYNLYNRLCWGRVGFQTHNLCEYLYGLVPRPLIGPPDLPPGEKFRSWYAGKSVVYDKYFHAPPDIGDRFKRFDLDLQSSYWKLQTVRYVPKRMDTSNWVLQLWYLTFLHGLSGSPQVDSVSRFRRILPIEKFFRWAEMPWRPYHYGCGD